VCSILPSTYVFVSSRVEGELHQPVSVDTAGFLLSAGVDWTGEEEICIIGGGALTTT
jgi:hypothetical protein